MGAQARPRLERLSGADASNLVFEHGPRAFAIALVVLLDSSGLLDGAGRPDIDRLRATLAPRVAGLPALNRRVLPTRWGQGRPVWLASPADLTRHVRLLPAVSGPDGLERLCGQLMSEPLPRDRPLWELLVVAGAAPDRLAVVVRLHHAIADGVAAVRLAAALFDPAGSAGPAPRPAAVPGRVDPVPTGRELRADALRTGLSSVAAGLGHPRRWPVAVADLATGLQVSIAMLQRPIPPTSLLGAVGARRGVALREVDLQRLRGGAHAAGGTVNDALLAAVAEGVRALLSARGERTDLVLPVSVPVSLRPAAAGGDGGGNRVGVMLVPVPLGEPDLAARVRLIAGATSAEKSRARARGTLPLLRHRWSTWLMDRLVQRQRLVAMFVTNVPGPQEPFHLSGAYVSSAWPIAPIGGNVRLGVSALSYAGRLGVSLVSDVDHVPDVQVAVEAMSAALEQLCLLDRSLQPGD